MCAPCNGSGVSQRKKNFTRQRRRRNLRCLLRKMTLQLWSSFLEMLATRFPAKLATEACGLACTRSALGALLPTVTVLPDVTVFRLHRGASLGSCLCIVCWRIPCWNLCRLTGKWLDVLAKSAALMLLLPVKRDTCVIDSTWASS